MAHIENLRLLRQRTSAYGEAYAQTKAEVAAEKKTRRRDLLKASACTLLTAAGVHYYGDALAFTGQYLSHPDVDAVDDIVLDTGIVLAGFMGLYRYASAGVSHFMVIRPNRNVMRAYAANGERYAEAGGLEVPDWVADELNRPRDIESIKLHHELGTLK